MADQASRLICVMRRTPPKVTEGGALLIIAVMSGNQSPNNDSGRRIDESLVHALDALLREANVSSAANRLGIAQSAMSRLLKSLRALTGDELLVRVGNKMVLTERAESLILPTRRLLADMSQLREGASEFEPFHAQITFRFASYDFLPARFFAGIMARVMRASPGSNVVLTTLRTHADQYRMLGEGELDALITIHDEAPPHLRVVNLLTDKVVCLMRKGHPLLRAPLTEGAYKGARHLGSVDASLGRHGSIPSALWAHRDMNIHAAVQAQYLGLTGEILVETDLVFATGQTFASSLAKSYELAMLPFPVDVPPICYRMLWHERAHRNSAQKWFREQIISAAKDLKAPARPA